MFELHRVLTFTPPHSSYRPATQLKTVGQYEAMKVSIFPKLWARTSEHCRNLKKKISPKNARSIEASHSLEDNVYNSPDASISKGPGIEHQTANAVRIPIASEHCHNLKREISPKNARSVEANHSLEDNVYNGPDAPISKGPSTEHQITDAIGNPIGSLAKIFSADLPSEIWTMVLKNLSQHDQCSCLRVCRKVCGSALYQNHDHANKFIRNCSGTRSSAMIHAGETSTSSVTSSVRVSA